MALTQVAVVYSIALGKTRRLIVPHHDDSELNRHTETLQTGEAVFLMPYADYAANLIDPTHPYLDFCDLKLAAYLGKLPLSDRCAVVDGNGKVVAVIAADPSIDAIPHCRLITSDVASTGWTYINGVFGPPE